MADTITMIMTMPDGEVDMAMSSASTIALAFAADSGGVRAVGTVSDYSSGMFSIAMGNMDPGGTGLSGDLEFVIATDGHVEVLSTPELASTGLPVVAPFQFNALDLFPRFPGHPLQPGDTWADTVTASADPAALGVPVPIEGTTESTFVYTYTLAGDTLVDGRSLRKITVSGAGTTPGSVEEAGQTTAGDLNNTLEGIVLWDAERGLVAAVDLVRTLDGSMSLMGMPVSVIMAGPTKLRLVN